MPLQKQPVAINFSQGLNTKADPFQIPPGQFLELENSIFGEDGLLKKRNGFLRLTSLPDETSEFVTTFNGNLTAIGTTINAYSAGSRSWVSKGTYQSLEVDVLSLIRSNTNQTQADSAISNAGLVCTVFTDVGPSSTTYKYVVADSETGQNIVAPTTIANVSGSPRAFLLGNYFVIVFPNAAKLQYIAINVNNPTVVTAAADLTTQYAPGGTMGAYDGVVANNNLYLAWNATDVGGAIRMTFLDSTLLQHGTVAFATELCTMMSVCADLTSASSVPVVYAAYYDSASSVGKVLAVNQNLSTVLAPTSIIAATTALNITCSAQNGAVRVFYEVSNAYSYDAALKSNFINTRSISEAGVVGSISTIARSVGLASKSFLLNSSIYMLAAFGSSYQPTYFLIDASGHVISKIAYSNGAGYSTKGLPSVSVFENFVQVPYLIKDLLIPVNKTQGIANFAGVYAQTGINLATFAFTNDNLNSAEIGNNLHLSGGILWAYDGYLPVEQGFHLWPDDLKVTTSGAGGNITAQQYYYVAVYEWTDNQGNIFRSAPSIPFGIVTVGATSTNTVNVPTLRLTYKTANPVKIVIYRWSTAQPIYYQVTSVTAPKLNSTTSDSIALVDTLADSSIIGNSILYTTGGVVENIGPPATAAMTLYKSRLLLIDAEDKNLLWYSKQVIEGAPVEMSDLFTLFVAPTVGAQGNTGDLRCLSAMDDKAILFKSNAIYYLVGNGPDNTGANNDFSDPVFITSTVGCSNQRSIVFIPQGIMFQSNKGVWLLGRDLTTQYIGAPVEEFNDDLVLSAITVPGTNQVRFTLESGMTLLYDYFYNQWGSFKGIPALSSTLYEDKHTFINSFGQAFQENPGSYLDGTRPVLMRFRTGWLNLAGLQGYERAYFFYLLGTYFSPHKLSIQIGYDYNENPSQSMLLTPDNFNGTWGDEALWGSSEQWGGPGNLEQWKIYFETQKCEAFQIIMEESFDATLGEIAGPGLTLSGLNFVVGVKSGYPRLPASRSLG